MSSAKTRLEQISEQVRQSQSTAPDLLCTTQEHSPGNNVATIVFSNPTKLNVASAPLLDKLIQTCHDLSKDSKLRAVVLTGAPPPDPIKTPAFIGGADVQELNRLSNSDEAKAYITRVHKACEALQDVPVPVIARVHGYALGAGLELMAACDLRLATKASKFGMPEVKIGLPSVAEAALFPGLIGVGRTQRLLYLGENIPGEMAEQWGLIERVVDDEVALDRAVDEWVGMLVSMGPQCIRNQKSLMGKWAKGTLQEGILAGVDALGDAYADGGKEAKEYMKPFLGKRK